ncbi:type I restriction enzyme HsdR N-terminal domain-containing protein [Aquimarina brevivitae]|uniref:Type I restriction and modification enzyme subunit R-like protein n=1 Tax=Aquimarina brevivitae TaxID=323412 RepID=A0A4Q7P2G9_9FLAO|nr:type I restriction enzyme HsdR N-terminal domain-containing protein [Aquimarina brevivitae]RZS93965.1 type I restriction and modification enzyme subunit R-like protein [Aquimarina brevivitae]
MQKLNFPPYQFRLKSSENKIAIFDDIRKKFVILTPEEWVRQHTVMYLKEEKQYPKSLMNIEKAIKINSLTKRYDVIIFHPNGKINVVVECKAPSVPITQDTFDQIARYNLALNADFLMITNGLNHYYCKMDYQNERYDFLQELPNYQQQTLN